MHTDCRQITILCPRLSVPKAVSACAFDAAEMNGVANTIAAILLVVCALLWLRAMYHQWTYTGSVKDINM